VLWRFEFKLVQILETESQIALVFTRVIAFDVGSAVLFGRKILFAVLNFLLDVRILFPAFACLFIFHHGWLFIFFSIDFIAFAYDFILERGRKKGLV
jgi:hypothetical protein